MATKTMKKQLEDTLRKTRDQINKIEQTEREQRNAEFVGRHFRYKNCYSCPEKPSDYWWMYIRVTGLKEGVLVVQKFQRDSRGMIAIETDEYYHQMLCGCQEITKHQYEKAFAKIMKDAGCVVS